MVLFQDISEWKASQKPVSVPAKTHQRGVEVAGMEMVTGLIRSPAYFHWRHWRAQSWEGGFGVGFVLFSRKTLAVLRPQSGWDWDRNQSSLSKQEYLCGAPLVFLGDWWASVEAKANVLNCLFFLPYKHARALFHVLSKCFIIWPTASSLLFAHISVYLIEGMRACEAQQSGVVSEILCNTKTDVKTLNFFDLQRQSISLATYHSRGKLAFSSCVTVAEHQIEVYFFGQYFEVLLNTSVFMHLFLTYFIVTLFAQDHLLHLSK